MGGRVVEVGRAGHDSKLAYCFTFLNVNGFFRLKALSYANEIDRIYVQKFLLSIFRNGYKYCQPRMCVGCQTLWTNHMDMNEKVMRTLITWLANAELISFFGIFNSHCGETEEVSTYDEIISSILSVNHRNQSGQFVFSLDKIVTQRRCTVQFLVDHLSNLLDVDIKFSLSGRV
eukprot:TRINITY_DN9575_c0_g2_i1.p1 TRINITY_DN9575_c0_g2~~TRINITY_DN9575_c0_g2_i1.p1  ORF type:complete len:174 (+),score=19.53 TRINITY_DN9575_c0_g2_i1:180-701(+)